MMKTHILLLILIIGFQNVGHANSCFLASNEVDNIEALESEIHETIEFGSNDQKMPGCEWLSRRWYFSYFNKLNPNIPLKKIPCERDQRSWSENDKIAFRLARAAYVLDETIFNRTSLPSTPLVSYGSISSPPASMLDWVAQRSKSINIDKAASYAYADVANKQVHLTVADINTNDLNDFGIGLAGQLIHEARHIGTPSYGHRLCKGTTDAYNCDPTITEEFQGGGSHAIAALWLAWVAKKSKWPKAEKDKAEGVVTWVLKNRINDSFTVRNNFSLRYLGKPLR